MADLLVLFDADCGFCSWSANMLHRLDRKGAVRLVPIHSAASVVINAPRVQDLLETLHARDLRGQWLTGADAWLGIAGAVPILRPIAIAGRVPIGRWWVGALYEVVARNRHRLSTLLGLERCTYRGG